MYDIIKLKTASKNRGLSSILVIYTGGTMGMAYDADQQTLVPFDFKEILDKLPELHRFELEITIISFEHPMDSSNMRPSHWIDLAKIIHTNYDTYDGFIVLHGTDTMAYTASALSFLLENLNKPVVFTGAQLPIGVVRTDARENFITALEIASAKKDGMAMVGEVCIYFNNFLLRGNRSKKVQSSHFDAFLSENYPYLAEAGVTMEYNQFALFRHAGLPPLKVYDKLETNVCIIKLFPGIDENYLRQVFTIPGLKGVVLETYGSGNGPTDDWFINSLKEAIDKGIVIYNVSQCIGGAVNPSQYLTSKRLNEIGVLSGGNITSEAAITKLMFVLANRKDNTARALTESLRGEMH
ncbi:MAG: asparaginase [Cytophagaceae bacterium]